MRLRYELRMYAYELATYMQEEFQKSSAILLNKILQINQIGRPVFHPCAQIRILIEE
jgi:hypothetical protein